jgi:hypothetical protein
MLVKKMFLIHDFLYESVENVPNESFDGKGKLKEVYVLLESELANEKEIDTTIENVQMFDSEEEAQEELKAMEE